jgi:hypothetical protein
MPERFFIAPLVGLANAALVYGVCDAMNTPRLWPGTLFAFATTTSTTLLFLHAIGRRGDR